MVKIIGQKVSGLDLFAGAGGMSLGAKRAGVTTLLAVENDPFAAQTYGANHPETPILLQDITTITEEGLPAKEGVSIIFGGPPCQGFSTSNQKTRSKENPADSKS